MRNSPTKDIVSRFHQQSAESCICMTKIPCNIDQNVLTTNEHKKAGEYSYPKRQDEWLAGRLATKNATTKLLNKNNTFCQPHDIEINNRKDGRPYLSLPTTVSTRVDISISHSQEYAIALASKNVCGIDIQKTKATLERVEKRFCSKKEFSILDKRYDTSKEIILTKLWATKEAVKKAACISTTMLGFTELQLTEITIDQNISYFHFTTNQRVEAMPKTYTAKVSYFSEYAIAICTIDTIPAKTWEKKDA